MAKKTAGTGAFTIPTSPVVGTTVAQSASANTYTATYVQLTASTPAAIFITGVYVNCTTGTNLPTYMSLQLATGGAGSETIVGQYNCPLHVSAATAGTVVSMYRPIYPWIAVATTTRIAAKTASSIASALSWTVTLEVINQSNTVDDGIPESSNLAQINSQTVTAAGAVTVLASVGTAATSTAQTGDSFARIGAAGVSLTNLGDTRIANLDAAVTTRMATYTQPSGFLAATFPSGTVANTTNITAGTITTTTNLTNAPTAGDLTATMKTSVTTAASAATPVATVSGDLSATMKTSVTTAASAATPVASLSGDFTATMKTSLGTAVGTAQTGDSFARLGVAGVGLTNLGDTRIANLNATVSSRLSSTDTRLDHLDADISSIAAGSGPTVVDIRTEMDNNSTKLAHLDADISSVSGGGGSAGIASLKRLIRSTRQKPNG